jgi:hypothetical protein
MKKIILFLAIISGPGKIFAQIDHSGSYGFQYKIQYDKSSSEKLGKDEQGRSGSLHLLKLDDGRYKFWLSASKGWPSYNLGELNGFITIKNSKAGYNEKNDYSEAACKIVFTFSANNIKIEQQSTDMDCGFGMGVYTDGDYKSKSANKLKNTDLENMNSGFSKYNIAVAKAYLYDDKAGNTLKNQYFIKGDKVIATDETDQFIYVEYISNSGKFIYGWLKKFEVKITK